MFLNFNYVLNVLNYVLNLRSKSTFCFVGWSIKGDFYMQMYELYATEACDLVKENIK